MSECITTTTAQKNEYHKKNIKFNISPEKKRKKIKLLFENVCGSIIWNLILRKLYSPHIYAYT